MQKMIELAFIEIRKIEELLKNIDRKLGNELKYKKLDQLADRGLEVANNIVEEAKIKQVKGEALATIRAFGEDIGELIEVLKDTGFDLVQTELAENHFHYAILAALNAIEQPEPKETCFKDAKEFTTTHTVKAFPATSREYSKLLGLENIYCGDREGYIIEDSHLCPLRK